MLTPLNKIAHKLSRYAKHPSRIIFMHVPKTGGTSLDGAMEALFPPNAEGNISFNKVTAGWKLAQSFRQEDQNDDLTWFQTINTVLSYKIACQAPYLSGHFAITPELIDLASGNYKLVTLFRDPIARWKSNYVYSRIREAQDGKRVAPADIAAELSEYMESPLGYREGAKYIRYLGGFRTPGRMRDPSVIDDAKRMLDRFDVVGVLEQMGRFESDLSSLVGKSIKVPHLRQTTSYAEPGGNTAETYKALFTPAIEERIRILCEPDYELYKHAQSRVASDKRKQA